jgi:hypothetical protein
MTPAIGTGGRLEGAELGGFGGSILDVTASGAVLILPDKKQSKCQFRQIGNLHLRDRFVIYRCARTFCLRSMTLGSNNREGVRSGLKVVTT